MVVLPSGTVTFLFTDIEGSTALWEAHPEEMREALARHDQLVRGQVVDFGGYVFASGGDGVAVAFSDAATAVRAALGVSAKLNVEAWPDPVRINVRMGLHSGTADERDGDYFGPTVNRAARVMALAGGGEVLVSAATAELVRVLGREGVTLVDQGLQRLRGVGEERIYAVLPPGVVGEGSPVRRFEQRGAVLPAPSTSFVGRGDEVALLSDALQTRRLVTLLGPGGVGKTRLSVEVARSVGDLFEDGVWIVGLDAVRDPEAVGHSMLAELSIRPLPGRAPLEALVAGLTQRRVLVVVDNCEHLVAAVAPLVRALLDRCPELTVLATSRVPLGVAGEQVWPVSPLASDEDAVELFISRALQSDPGFDASTSRDAMAALCSRLDRMPLAIELAAARVRALAPAELLARLDGQFRLLRAARAVSSNESEERHRTLVTTVDWSYQLLDERSQEVFAQLCVFTGSFDLDAAVALCAGPDLDELDVIDAVATLVDHSMISTEGVGTRTSYRMLETIRAFGLIRLEDRGTQDDARRRHADWIAAYAAELLRGLLSFDAGLAMRSLTDLDRCWAELRAAVHWAITADEAEIAVGLVGAFHSTECVWRDRAEVGGWAEQVLAMAGAFEYELVENVLGIAVTMDWRAGRFDTMALRLRRRAELPAGTPKFGAVFRCVAVLRSFEGRLDEARRLFDDAIDVLADRGADFDLEFLHLYRAAVITWQGEPAQALQLLDTRGTATSPLVRAAQAWIRGLAQIDVDPETALVTLREAALLAKAARSSWLEDSSNASAFYVLATVGDVAEAAVMLRSVLGRAAAVGSLQGGVNTVRYGIVVLQRLGHLEAAAVCSGWVEAQSLGSPGTPHARSHAATAMDTVDRQLGPERRAGLASQGSTLSTPEVIEYLRGQLDQR